MLKFLKLEVLEGWSDSYKKTPGSVSWEEDPIVVSYLTIAASDTWRKYMRPDGETWKRLSLCKGVNNKTDN